jgi:hypothetical protein
MEKRKKGGTQVKHYMRKNVKIPIILVTLTAVILLAAFWASTYIRTPPFEPRRPFQRSYWDIELFYSIKTVISTVNVTLLVFLLVTYIDIYRKTASEFTVGLIIFSLILLFYAFFSNPMVQWLFGFRAAGLGPFVMLPDLFTCIALSVLLYLTIRY